MDPHKCMLARLDWELEQRKRFAGFCQGRYLVLMLSLLSHKTNKNLL